MDMALKLSACIKKVTKDKINEKHNSLNEFFAIEKSVRKTTVTNNTKFNKGHVKN